MSWLMFLGLIGALLLILMMVVTFANLVYKDTSKPLKYLKVGIRQDPSNERELIMYVTERSEFKKYSKDSNEVVNLVNVEVDGRVMNGVYKGEVDRSSITNDFQLLGLTSRGVAEDRFKEAIVDLKNNKVYVK